MVSASSQAQWVHLAGNPPNVVRQEPPYWRLRMGRSGPPRLLTSWSIRGRADATNNHHGIELGASFLLWWELYGEVVFTKKDDQTHAVITLQSPPLAAVEPIQAQPLVAYDYGVIRIFGAPDQVGQGSSFHWRCEVTGAHFPVTGFVITGEAFANVKPGEDIANENPLRRLWLEITGQLTLYSNHQARIQLV